MKKHGIALAMAALLLLNGASVAEETAAPEEENSIFDPIQISLWGNPTTGYEWTCEYENNGVLEAPMQEYIEDAHEEDMAGVGGTYDFYFGVRSAGRAQIMFNYGLSWGVGAPEQTVIATVVVAEDGSFRVRWAQVYSGDQTLMVVLPSNPTTGWDWSYEDNASGMVSLTSDSYAATDEDLAGAGGNSTYLFHVEKPGETVLMFNYANMWDPYAAAEETYAVTLTVTEDMEISISVDG